MRLLGPVFFACSIVVGCGDAGSEDPSGTAGAGAAGGGAGTGGELGSGGFPDTTARCTPVNLEPQPLDAGPLLEDAALAELFTATTAFLKSRTPDPDPQGDALAVRAWATTAPHVQETGIGQDCTVWLRLTDGTSVSLFEGREEYGPGDPNPLEALVEEASAEPSRLPPRAPPDGEPVKPLDLPLTKFELPASEKAFLASGHNMAPHAVPFIDKALTARGYKVDAKLTLKLADLRALSDLGVLYLSTHGMTCHNSPKARTGYCIVTDDAIDPTTAACVGTAADCAAINADRSAGIVGYAVDRSAGGADNPFYALNDGFVEKYWSFAANSLVYLDSCESMDDVVETEEANTTMTYAFAPLFRAALQTKGAATLVGWHELVSRDFAQNTAGRFFDRVLGNNKLKNVTPKQRPFSTYQVYEWLSNAGLTKDPDGEAVLLHGKLGPNDVILAPSIRNMVIGDPTQPSTATEKSSNTELTIYGEFGTRAVDVTVGGAAASIVTAKTSSNVLVVTLPGPQSKGAVEITVPTGSKTLSGNEVPLTSWTGNCRWKTTYSSTFGPPGIWNEQNCSNVHLRGDVHPFRMAPEEAAAPGTADADDGFSTEVIFRNSVSDTVCQGSVGGTSNPAGYTMVLNPNTVTPGWVENVTSAIPEAPSPFFLVLGRIDTSDPRALRIAVWPANRVTSSADLIYPSPLPPQHIDDFSTTVTGLTYMDQYMSMTSNHAFNANFGSITLSTGDMGEMQCTMTADASTVPTADTEG